MWPMVSIIDDPSSRVRTNELIIMSMMPWPPENRLSSAYMTRRDNTAPKVGMAPARVLAITTIRSSMAEMEKPVSFALMNIPMKRTITDRTKPVRNIAMVIRSSLSLAGRIKRERWSGLARESIHSSLSFSRPSRGSACGNRHAANV